MFLKKKAIAIIVAAGLTVSVAGCSQDKEMSIMEVQSNGWIQGITTDLARYEPGTPVQFTLQADSQVDGSKLLVRYKHMNEVLKEETHELSGEELTWSWTPPKDDFRGYMVETFIQQDGSYIDQENIAVDVSSDWGKYPRYGYLADFHEMEDEERKQVIERLNRFHINGIQFYDWQYTHHIPLKWESEGVPAQTWPDIANRPVSYETVEDYIDLAHAYNMKAMNYNLLFGAYEGAEADGVKKEWGMFKDPKAKTQDTHPLPDSWASDIYLLNPANEEWQQYLFETEKEVFELLPFDGWHVDQLGDRGLRFDAKGKKIDLAQSYAPFLNNAKSEIDVDYVMNAVGQYGQAFLATQAPVKFLYTEVWGGHPQYRNLKGIIDENLRYSKGKLGTVLAAYMNYDHANAQGEFNTPGVLLTDAVIFAAGGSHLELGENMLAKEYFPNKNLSIPNELEQALVRYYDFAVAYENVLRDELEEIELTVTSEQMEISADAEKGKVWSFAKQKDNRTMIHLINFSDAVHMTWNDAVANQSEPQLKEQVEVTVEMSEKVSQVWMATPDAYEGSAVPVEFEQEGDQVKLTLPSLKYWDMIVMETE
ncbi:glycoside hydrolase family 66 protein [Marinicrinis sediminis]|uniref:Glycoside hydrolase family 66 protein n=1 Tax=Marinicrinis sediminis TaxID=1652465 RepID=A0ABW5R8L2_9BACL